MSLTNREMMFYRAFCNRQCVAIRKAEMGPEVIVAHVVNNPCSVPSMTSRGLPIK